MNERVLEASYFFKNKSDTEINTTLVKEVDYDWQIAYSKRVNYKINNNVEDEGEINISGRKYWHEVFLEFGDLCSFFVMQI